MSSVSERTKTTVRHEYVVSSPAMWADIKEAMVFASNARIAAGLRVDYDDVIQVVGNEEEVVVYWEEESK